MNIHLTLIAWACALWILTILWYSVDIKRINMHLAIVLCLIGLTCRSFNLLDAIYTIPYAIITAMAIMRYWMDISARDTVRRYSGMRANISNRYIEYQKYIIQKYSKRYRKFNGLAFLIISIGIISHSVYMIGTL